MSNIAKNEDNLKITSYEQLTEKWQQIQYKGFKNWVNVNLVSINQKVDKLETDFQNGVKFSALIEILSQKKIMGISPNPKFQMQKMSNITLTLELLKKENVKLENIGTVDIYDSNLKLIMGLIWILILHYQINMLKVDEESKNLGAKEKILLFCRNLVKGYPVEVNNLTTDFSSGSVLACMVHAKKPTILNPQKIIDSKDYNANLTEILDLLEKEFQVPHLINAEDIIEEPEEKAMMTFLSYVIQYVEKFPTVAFGLEEEVIEEPIKVESKPHPTLDLIPTRILNMGRGENSEKDAYFVRENNQWKPVSWKGYSQQVLQVAKSYVAEGVKKGDKISIMGRSAASWTIAYLAAQTIGAIPVGIYETSSPSTVKYILEHSESKVVFVHGEPELKKVLEVRSSLPLLKRVVVFKESGENGCDGNTLSWDQFLNLGSSIDEQQVIDLLIQVEENDDSVFIYTSGTTGPPKAVILTHKNLQIVSTESVKLHGFTSEDYGLSYLPLCHIAEQNFSILIPSACGAKIYYNDGPTKIFENLKELQPTMLFGPPRIWEKMYTSLSTKVPPQQVESLTQEQKLELLKSVGISKARFACSGAAPIDLGILNYFLSLGRLICEVYGQSEDTGPTSYNTLNCYKLGSVGKPFPGLEVKIAEDGEILAKGPTVFRGYFKDPETTESTLKDGWLYSGDLGKINDEGFLFITGRKKDIIITAGGKNITPINIELALKKHPFIGDATVCGDRKKFLTALLSPDVEVISHYCKERNIDPKEFVNSDEFKNGIREHVNLVNKELGQVEKVKKYTILPVSFSIEGGEVTPTLKMKRAYVNQKYAKEIDLMYAATIPDFPSLLGSFVTHALDNENKDAYYVKNGEKWQSVTWGTYFTIVRNVSKSLIHNKVQPHQKVLIISNSLPNSSAVYLSSQFVNAIPVALYPETSLEDIQHVANDTKAHIVFVEGKDQFDRINKHKNLFPNIKKIVLLKDGEEEKGAESWEEFLKGGEDVDEQSLDSRVLGIKPEDISTLVYKNLATPNPKGVSVNHKSLFNNTKKISEITKSDENTKYLCLRSPADLNEQYFSILVPILSGSKTYFGDLSNLNGTLKEVQPNILLFPSKKWGKISTALQRQFPSDKAQKSNKGEKEKEREKFGLKDVSFAISTDGPLTKNEDQYFNDIECPVLPLFEELEAANPITFSTRDSRKYGTSGKPIEGVTVEIGGELDENGNGEIIALKPNLFSGYNNEPKSFEQKVTNGKLKTDSIGKLDDEGFLIVCGNKSDQVKLNNGVTTFPRDIEKELREHPLVDDAIVLGNGRKYLVALLTIDEEEAKLAAKENNMELKDFYNSPLFNETIQNHVDSVNERFPEKDRVKRYQVLFHPFTVPNKEVIPGEILNRELIEKNYTSYLDNFDTQDFQVIENRITQQLNRLKKDLNKIAFRLPNLEDEMGTGFIEKYSLNEHHDEPEIQSLEELSDKFINVVEKRTEALDVIVETLKVKNIEEKEKRVELEEKNNIVEERVGVLIENLNEVENEINELKVKNTQINKEIQEISLKIPLNMRQGTPTVPPPTGIVTLVFTDVENSTLQWEKDAKVMAQALSLHNNIMREKINEYKGYEVKTEGDAFMIAFTNPLDATKWCIDVQQTLLTLDWPEPLFLTESSSILKNDQDQFIWRGLRVRMGIHRGEPSCEPDPITGRMDYFGRMVNRSARVESMAKGGQILVSEDAFEGIKDNLKELGDPIIIELGEFELKGLEKKEFIRQVSPLALKDRVFEKTTIAKDPVEQKSDMLKEKLKKLEEENEELLNKMSELEERAKKYVEEANQLALMLKENTQKDNKELSKKLIEMVEKQKLINNDLVESKNKNKLLTENFLNLNSQLNLIKEENQKLNGMMDNLSDKLNLLEKELKQLREENQKQKEEIKEKDLTIQNLEDTIKQLQEKGNNTVTISKEQELEFKTKIDNLSDENKSLKEDSQKALQTLEESVQQLEKSKENENDLANKLKESQGENEKLSLANQGLANDLESAKKQLQEVEKCNKECDEHKKKLIEENEKFGLDNQSLANDLELAKKQLLDLEKLNKESGNDLANKLKESQGENEKLSLANQGLANDLESAKKQLLDLEKLNNENQGDLANKLKESQGENEKLSLANQGLNNDLESAKKQLQEVEKCNKECDEHKKKLIEENEKFGLDNQGLANDLELAKKQLLNSEKLNKEAEEYKKKLNEENEELKRLIEELKKTPNSVPLNPKLLDLHREMKENQQKIEDTASKVKQLFDENEDLTNVSVAIAEALNDTSDMLEISKENNDSNLDTLTKESEALDQAKKQLTEAQNEYKELVENLEKQLAQYKEDNKNYEDQISQSESENTGGGDDSVNITKRNNLRQGVLKFENLINDAKKQIEIIPKTIKEIDTLQTELDIDDNTDLDSEEGASKSIQKLLENIENQIQQSNKKVESLQNYPNDYNSQSQIQLHRQLVKDLASLSDKIKKTLSIKSAQAFVYDAYIGYENILLAFQKKLEGLPNGFVLNKTRWVSTRRIYTTIINNRLTRWQIKKNNYLNAQKEPVKESPSPQKLLVSTTTKLDDVDDEVSSVLNELGVEIPVKKLGVGQYMVGNKKLNMKILNGFLVVRIGGGYMRFKEFIEKHAKSLGVIINPNPIGKVGSAFMGSHGKMNLIEKK